MRFRTVLVNAVGAFVLWSSAGAQTQGGAGPYSVSIPAEPLGDALNELAQQTGLQILFSSELVAHLHAAPVKGSLTADAALQIILGTSGLKFEFVNPRTIAILGPPAADKKFSGMRPEKTAEGNGPADNASEPVDQSRESVMPHKSLMARLLAVFAVCSAAVHGGVACGQEVNAHSTTNAATELEEVVVTAQKRSESIQQVPIAITAFSESTLRAKGITDIHGLSALTPNVNLDQGSPFSGSNSVLSASIRGIGQDDFAFNLDPGVGVYVDGVYFARTVGANQSLLDVERIEILKGPQGTLFGRNTIGGAISIVTRTPGEEFNIQSQLTGGSFNRRDVSVLADIPLAPNLLSTVTVATQYQDGYEKRIPYPSPVPYVSDPVGALHSSGTEAFDTQGGTNQQTVRAKVLWKASDSLRVTFAGDWTHTNQPSTASTVLATVTQFSQGGTFGPFFNDCLLGLPPATALICGPRGVVGTPLWQANLNPATTRLLYGNAVTHTGNIDTTYADGQNFDKLDSYGAAATVDWDIDNAFKFRSITSSRRLHWTSGLDADGSPIDFFELSFAEGQHQISQEFQLIGDLFDSKLKLVAGLYYFDEGGYINDFVTFGGGLLQVDGPNELETRSYAAYLHADYKVTDNFGVTLGGRFSEDRKTFTGGQQDLNGFVYKASGCYPYNSPADQHLSPLIPPSVTCQEALGYPNPSNPLQVYPYGENHQNFNEFTPTLGAQYHFTDEIMAYASYAKGFKTGGWTTRLEVPLPLGSAAPSFGPETDRTYEVGLKSEWFDRQLIVNAATFLSHYDDIQLTYQISSSPVTQNAGNAEIKGFELEVQTLLNEHFSMSGNVGYLDAKYTEINQYALATTGSELPKTPRLKFSLSPDVHTRLPNGATLRLGVDYTHTSEMFNDVQNTPLLARPKEDMFNASTAIIAPDGRVTFTIGGTNLSDRRFITTGQPQVAGGVVFGSYNAPREWYATIGLKY
jgi:iron complex outermembrane recepter protein